MFILPGWLFLWLISFLLFQCPCCSPTLAHTEHPCCSHAHAVPQHLRIPNILDYSARGRVDDLSFFEYLVHFVFCRLNFILLFPFLIKYYYILFIIIVFWLGCDRPSGLPFFAPHVSFFILFHSCCSHALVFGKTLVHEFPISYSHTEFYLVFFALWRQWIIGNGALSNKSYYMERLVKGRLITHLEKNNLIGDSQHGSETNVAAWQACWISLPKS